MLKNYMVGAALVALGGLLMCSTGACGSGGGTTGPVSPLLLYNGTYCLLGFEGEAGVPDMGAAFWGDIIADGAGMIGNGTTTQNTNGVLSGPDPTGSFPYTVDANRRFTWMTGGMDVFQGGLSADGALAFGATILGGVDPTVFLMLRKQGAYSLASLSGLYHLCSFFYNSGGVADGAIWGTLTFDGVGGTTASVSSNNDGAISGPAALPPAAYTVAADGTVTWTLAGAPVQGAALAGGNLVVLSGATTATGIQLIVILVRAGAGLSNAIFSGNYHAVGLIAPNGGAPKWRSVTGTASADGAGMVTLDPATANEDGVIAVNPGGPAAYAVAANGAFTSASFSGGISPDGSVVAVAGGTTGGDDPEFFVLFK